jgi:hypothetical protein
MDATLNLTAPASIDTSSISDAFDNFWSWLTQPSIIATDPNTGMFETDVPANEFNAVSTAVTTTASNATSAVADAVTSAASAAATNATNAALPVLVWGGAALVGFILLQRIESR